MPDLLGSIRYQQMSQRLETAIRIGEKNLDELIELRMRVRKIAMMLPCDSEVRMMLFEATR